MTGGESVFFAFGAMLAVASMALMAAAIATPGWYEIHSGATHQRVGFFEFCNVTGGPIPFEKCFKAPFGDDFCGHSSSDFKLRQGLSAGFGIAGAALLIPVCILLFLGWWRRRWTGLVTTIALVFLTLTIALYVASIIIICLFFEKFYYCETDYCDFANRYLGATDCAFFHGYSFVYSIIAAILTALTFAIIIGLKVHHCANPSREEEEEAEAEEDRKRLNGSSSSPTSRRDSGMEPAGAQDNFNDINNTNNNRSQSRGGRGRSTSRGGGHAGNYHDDANNTYNRNNDPYHNRSRSGSQGDADPFGKRADNQQQRQQAYRAPDSTTPTLSTTNRNRQQPPPPIQNPNASASTSISTQKRLHFDDDSGAVQRIDSPRYNFNNAPPLPSDRSPQRERGGGGGAYSGYNSTAQTPSSALKNKNNRARPPTDYNNRPPTDFEVMMDDDDDDNLNEMSQIRGGRSASRGQYPKNNNNVSGTSFQTAMSQGPTSPSNNDANNGSGKLTYWPSDWVFHTQSGLYWSEGQQLYLDPKSEHYYDPHSNKWYDPKRDVWYSKV